MKKNSLPGVGFIVFAFLALSFSLIQHAFAATGINSVINFQGKVVNKTDGTNVNSGTTNYNMVFSIYDAATSGTQLWTETWNGANQVAVSNGLFQVSLGSITPFGSSVNFNQSNLYLDVTFNGEDMTTRIPLTAVPYAFNSVTLDGVIATQSANGFNLQGGTSTLSTVHFNTTGTTLTINPTNAGGLTLQSNGANGVTLDTGGTGAVTIGGTNATSLGFGNATTNPTYTFSGTGGISGATIALTPGSNTTGLTVTGTNVTSANLVNFSAKNTSGTIVNESFAAATTLGGSITGQNINLSTNVTATNQSATGIAVTLPGATNTNTSGTNNYIGLTVSSGGGVTQNGAGGTTTINGLDITSPNITQTNGTITANGALITTGTITTGGTENGINISASGVGAGTLNALNISGITQGAGKQNGIFMGTGWNANIAITAGAAGAPTNFTIKDNNATQNTLFEVRDLTNANNNKFYGLALADAFASKQSYFGEDFNQFKATCTDTPTTTATNFAGRRGNISTGCAATTGEFSTSDLSSGTNAGSASFSSNAANNGFERIACTGTSSKTDSCLETTNNGTAGQHNTIINTGNMPQILMKWRAATALAAANYYFIGISTIAVAKANTANTDKGVYFTNCNSPTSATCSTGATTWIGVVQDGTNAPNIVSCPATDGQGSSQQSGNFMFGRIEFRRDTSGTGVEIQFFIDYDVTNGIAETSCGTITTTTSAMGNTGMGPLLESVSGSATATNLDVNYFHVWQDDPATSGGLVADTQSKDIPSQNSKITSSTPVPSPAPASDSARLLANISSEDAVFPSTYPQLPDIRSLSVEGLATVSGDLRVKGNSLIEGVVSVVDTLTAHNMIVNSLAHFFGNVFFHNTVTFQGNVHYQGNQYTNSDTAGVVTIPKDSDSVSVNFKKPYEGIPIVNISLFIDTADQNQKKAILRHNYIYAVLNRSPKGFTIGLNKNALEDISFSWIVFGMDTATDQITPAVSASDSAIPDTGVSPATTGAGLSPVKTGSASAR